MLSKILRNKPCALTSTDGGNSSSDSEPEPIKLDDQTLASIIKGVTNSLLEAGKAPTTGRDRGGEPAISLGKFDSSEQVLPTLLHSA